MSRKTQKGLTAAPPNTPTTSGKNVDPAIIPSNSSQPQQHQKKRRKSKTPKNPQADRARATGRQRQYVRGVLKGKTKQQAKRDAGYSDNTKGKEIESRPAVKQLFTELLEAAGIHDRVLAQKLYQGIFAMQSKFATHEGTLSDQKNLVDFGTRRDYLELILKLKGHLIDKHELRMVRTYEEILDGSNE